MYESKNEPLLSTRLFLRRFTRNLLLGLLVILLSLGGGMLGYAHFEKMSLVDSFVNAAMILSGMGPVSTLQTEAGKIFAGFYALFSGIVFLFIMAMIFSPVIHRFLHKFHLVEEKPTSKF
jgi:hypothetical protein